MVQTHGLIPYFDKALLDSGSTHTLVRNFLNFSSADLGQECNILTIAKSQNFKFREGRTTTVLPKGFLLMCVKAMYARAL